MRVRRGLAFARVQPDLQRTRQQRPIITADIHKRASDCANRRGITIPNTEIGFDPVDSTRRSDDIDLTIHDQYSDEGIIEEILLELAVVDEKQ